MFVHRPLRLQLPRLYFRHQRLQGIVYLTLRTKKKSTSKQRFKSQVATCNDSIVIVIIASQRKKHVGVQLSSTCRKLNGSKVINQNPNNVTNVCLRESWWLCNVVVVVAGGSEDALVVSAFFYSDVTTMEKNTITDKSLNTQRLQTLPIRIFNRIYKLYRESMLPNLPFHSGRWLAK